MRLARAVLRWAYSKGGASDARRALAQQRLALSQSGELLKAQALARLTALHLDGGHVAIHVVVAVRGEVALRTHAGERVARELQLDFAKVVGRLAAVQSQAQPRARLAREVDPLALLEGAVRGRQHDAVGVAAGERKVRRARAWADDSELTCTRSQSCSCRTACR